MSGGVVTPPRLPRRTGPLPDLDAVIQRATQLRNKLDQYQVRALRRTPCDYLLPRHRVATHAAPCQRACAHLGAAGAVRQWLHGQLGAASAASPNCLLDPRAGTASRARALHCACEQMPRGVSPRNVAGEPRSAARHRRGTRAGQRVAGAARQRGPARRERWLRGLSSDRALLLHTSSRTQLATTREGCCCSSEGAPGIAGAARHFLPGGRSRQSAHRLRHAAAIRGVRRGRSAHAQLQAAHWRADRAAAPVA